jgi:bifunctional NMN adenylyltransferase/nudix hydrolase
MREFSHLVFIGRFQPLHNGHVDILERALALSDRVIVLVGSSNLARSPRNPFTFDERRLMLEASVASNEVLMSGGSVATPRLIVRPINDCPYSDTAWITQVQRAIQNTVLESQNPNPNITLHGMKDARVGLIGFSKDHTSYYLKKFPEMKSVNVPTQFSTLSSTDLRADYLRRAPHLPGDHLVPAPVARFLRKFIETEHFKWLVAEQEFYTSYRKSWEAAPFPPTIMCADAVVIQSGNVLLIRRKNAPGKGLWALPGGHVEQQQTLRQAVIAELRQETAISDSKGEIPPAMLASFIAESRMFDDPGRSMRGRVITQASLFKLPERTEMFKVDGRDDADGARWVPLGSIDPHEMFEDHAAIIEEMTGARIEHVNPSNTAREMMVLTAREMIRRTALGDPISNIVDDGEVALRGITKEICK